MNFISDFIAGKLITFEIISKDDEDIYRYGIEQGLFSILNFVTALLIGLVFNMVWQTILFLISYITVRKYAGGFHSSTPTRCYFLSSAMLAAALYLNTILVQRVLLNLFITLISIVLIWVMSPVEDSNKPLDEKEKQVYAQKARHRLLLISVMAVIAWQINIYEALGIVSLAMLNLAIMLIIGRLKNYSIQQKNITNL